MHLKTLLGKGNSQGQVLGEGTHAKREEVEPPSTPSDDRLLSCFEGLRLANIDNWCFINSAFLATTWALLCSHSFTLDSWGPHASQFGQILYAISIIHSEAFD